jgi:hypothetical protein
MMTSVFSGSPQAIGRSMGEQCAAQIASNLEILVRRTGYGPPPRMDAPMLAWIDEQERVITKAWPWLIEEMQGTAEGAGQSYRDILLLNLRIWQYDIFGAGPNSADTACSSLVIRLHDGTVANVGSLDDPPGYYCGLVQIQPSTGLSFRTFPIAGTCWGNRGMNSAGLTLGISSQALPGLPRRPGSICGDIALRAILQTCETVDQVRTFCQRHPFTRNLVCSDRHGAVFCAHQTTVGTYALSSTPPFVMTNHVIDDALMFSFAAMGVRDFMESATTRLRRGRLLDFAATQHGKVTGEAIRAFVAERMNGDPAATCPPENLVLTYCNPQAEPGVLWLAAPKSAGNPSWVRHEDGMHR